MFVSLDLVPDRDVYLFLNMYIYIFFLNFCYRTEPPQKMTFKPTVPKGPIAAMYSSPGPCYQLPTLVGQQGHDSRSTHQRAPSYQFGIRHGARTDNCSPGPKYNFSEFQVYRDGKDGTPHYSLYSRPRDSTTFKTPGPGTYSPETTTSAYFASAPIHSFGQRHKHRTTDLTPGRVDFFFCFYSVKRWTSLFVYVRLVKYRSKGLSCMINWRLKHFERLKKNKIENEINK